MEKVKITFADGTVINADVNGDCFIVDEEPVFPDDTSVVFIERGETTQILQYVVIQESASIDGRYWFTFVKMSDVEIRFAEIEDALCELSME